MIKNNKLQVLLTKWKPLFNNEETQIKCEKRRNEIFCRSNYGVWSLYLKSKIINNIFFVKDSFSYSESQSKFDQMSSLFDHRRDLALSPFNKVYRIRNKNKDGHKNILLNVRPLRSPEARSSSLKRKSSPKLFK